MALNILNGVNLQEPSISKEARELSEQVKNKSLSLVDRVESYQDIISIEVGDTSFSRVRNLERESGIRQLYVKFEGGNPSGTQKDRIAFAQCHDALRRGYDTITVATCGNYGAAVALAANLAGLKCIIHIPTGYHTARISEMEKLGARVQRFEGSYEATVGHSHAMAELNDWYDANPGGLNTALQIMAYSEIANEIYDIMRDAPKLLAVPVSNGTLLAGIFRGFETLYKRGKTSRLPRIVAASSSHKNPIITSFKKNLEVCEDLHPDKVKESKINEPLINWHSFDGNEALWALRQTQGEAFHVTDKQMLQLAKTISEKEGIKVLPAATAGLSALLEMHSQTAFEHDRYVAIITARQ